MSVPAVIDSLDFARSGQHLSGRLPVKRFNRLEDVLSDADGEVDFDLQGRRDERNRPLLVLQVAGTLHLQCQRCLGSMDFPLAVENRLLLVPRGAPDEEDMDDPEAPDRIEASDELDVAQLVEDEILLSLPLSPRHAEGTCASRLAAEQGAEQAEPKAAKKPSPFAKLAALKNTDTKS